MGQQTKKLKVYSEQTYQALKQRSFIFIWPSSQSHSTKQEDKSKVTKRLQHKKQRASIHLKTIFKDGPCGLSMSSIDVSNFGPHQISTVAVAQLFQKHCWMSIFDTRG